MSRQKGFTLIEMLVVIAIILVLITILIPTISHARIAAQRAQCLSNVRQLALRVITYANENGGEFPLEARNLNPKNPLSSLVDPAEFRGDVFAALALPIAVWQCPNNSWYGYSYDATHGSMFGFMPHVKWPAARNVPNLQMPYMYLANGYNLGSDSYEADPARRPANVRTKDASRKTLFADRVYYSLYYNNWVINHTKPNRLDAAAGASQSFADGHAEWVTNYPYPMVRTGAKRNASLVHQPKIAGVGSYEEGYWW